MQKKRSAASAVLLRIALLMFIGTVIFFSLGIDKMYNYYNSENYPSSNKNAYVGGDAYNYIINGNYATGFFVLSMGCMISGVICICCRMLILVQSPLEDQHPNAEENTITQAVPELAPSPPPSEVTEPDSNKSSGKDKSEKPKIIRCYYCGYENNSDADVCAECGSPLVKPKSATD